MNWPNALSRFYRSTIKRQRRIPKSSPEETNQIKNCKLTRRDVERLIESHGGSEGLDLSGADLSEANLNDLDLHGAIFGSYDPHLPRTNLAGARLVRANLKGAKLLRANLQGARMYLSNLQEADLRYANFSHANLYGADLRDANLFRARLYGTDLWEAKLEGADLYLAFFDDLTHLSRESIGRRVLQQNRKRYKAYVERRILPTSRNSIETHLQDRHSKAREVYLRLKSAFSSAGRYDDASWAYFKQRQMERLASAPWRARNNYARWFFGDRRPGLLNWVWFYIRYTVKWLLDWAAELTCGYGEKPFRTVICASVALVIFPLLYLRSGGVLSRSGPMSWLDYFNYSFGAFTTIGFSQFEPVTPLAQTLTSIEALLGIAALALLMFALGNRLSRS